MRLRAFGLEVDCRLDLPGVPANADSSVPATLTVVPAGPDELATAWTGDCDPLRQVERSVDDRPLTIERGAGNDVRIRWGAGDGEFHIDPENRVLRAGAGAEPDARWRRVLLDSALATAALVLGGHALHAGAVVVGGAVVAVTGHSGSGKTSLVAELVRAGCPLMCDDVLAITRSEESVLGHPGPPVMNLPADGGPTAGLGQTIARIDDEAWVAVARTAAEPAPLRALLFLDRGGERPLALDPVPAPAAPVLGALLTPGPDPDRQLRHFELAADLAELVAILRLVAPASAVPAELAEFVTAALGN